MLIVDARTKEKRESLEGHSWDDKDILTVLQYWGELVARKQAGEFNHITDDEVVIYLEYYND